MPIKLPQIIGHRGACGYAPENTIESVHTAADMGVEWVELDVKLTKDDVPIIFHDDTLDRTTNGHGAVADITWAELQDLEAGSWFSDSFAGIRIPSLEDMLDTLVDLDLGLNLEIKPCPGREKETAEAALDVLSRVWDDHNRLLISSFQHVSLETALEMAPDWHRGFLLGEDIPENWQDLANYLAVSTININGNATSDDTIRALQDGNRPLLAYTINDHQKALQLQGLGIKSFFTDVPDVLQDSLLTVH